jgi:hypothetical protein
MQLASIPVVTLFFIKKRVIAFLTSWIFGSAELISIMIFNEIHSENSEFDIVFLFAIFFWTFILGSIYFGIILFFVKLKQVICYLTNKYKIHK